MGFPSPADDHADMPLNLHDHLITHPAATYFWRYSGFEMDRVGIASGALLIIDRSLTAKEGDVVAAIHQGEALVRKFVKNAHGFQLITAPLDGEPELIEVGQGTFIWGVVIHAVNHLRPGAVNMARYRDISDGQG